jgi:hypothetical protein
VRAEAVRTLIRQAVAASAARDILENPAYMEVLGQGPLAPPPSAGVDLQAVRKYWGEAAPSSPDPRPDVWNHPDFGSPDRDFKLDLFPALALSGLLALEGGNGKAGLSLRIAGKGLLRDKSIELQALVDHLHPWGGQSVTASNRAILATGASGIQSGAGRKWEAAVLFNLFSTAMRGVYFGGSVRAADFTFRREWVVPNGLEGARSGYVVTVERLPVSINAEAGYSYRLPFNFPMSLRVGLSGPLFRQSVTPDDAPSLRYYRYPNPVDVRISFEFGGFKLKGRRHPLEGRPE